MNVLGIMSGTSLDGIDYVLCKHSEKKGLKFKDRYHVKFNKEIKDKLTKAVANQLDFWSVAELHYNLGAYYSSGLKKAVNAKNWKVDLIGLHGQTVYHNPRRCTFQIGEASFLKRDFGVPVVSQFRNSNVAAKGHGAPFAPFFHKYLMKDFKQIWAFQNIGGMGNVSFINKNRLYAFDTGPGNILIDECVQENFGKTFDKNGSFAAKGLAHLDIIENWLKNISYFTQKPPKTCGRESFSYQALHKELKGLKYLRPEDQVATLTEFTVLSLKNQYQNFVKPFPKIIIVSGGGAKNKHLMKRMKFHFSQQEVVDSEELMDWPVDAIEGGAFAWLALQRYQNKKITDLSSVTGAKGTTQLGVLL